MVAENPEHPEDEWDVDFENPRPFVKSRWEAICDISLQKISLQDRNIIQQCPDLKTAYTYFQQKFQAAKSPTLKLRYDELRQFVRVYRIFDKHFSDIMKEYVTDISIVVGTLFLVIELCRDSEQKLLRVAEVITKVQRQLDLFNRCNTAYHEEREVPANMVGSLEAFISILVAIVEFMHKNLREMMDPSTWDILRRETIEPRIVEMGEMVKHLHNIAAFTTLRDDRQTNYVKKRTAGGLLLAEHGEFPCMSVPLGRYKKFWGREDVISEIDQYLSWEGSDALRTYTLYGRRGVGKTYIAVEYAYRKASSFDAIFWIQCETAASIRNSFTRMAVTLKLPGAVQGGAHEDNLRLCHNWLRKTAKHWLLIFDNAENEKLLEAYWPVSKGAILITTRNFINFNSDPTRKGITVKPFDEEDRWNILVNLLDWQDYIDRGRLAETELDAAKNLVDRGKGLGLAIDLIKSLILLYYARKLTIEDLLQHYDKYSEELPPRRTHTKESTSHAVDILWKIAFEYLSKDAKALLSVLCLLSPDETRIEVFNPRNQDILSPFLEFCKQENRKIATIAPELQKTIAELLDASLIRREKNILSVHRVVQEAFFHVFVAERQSAYDAAVKLISEAFPKQVNGRPLFPVWERCENYIQDGLFLAYKFRDFKEYGASISAPKGFSELLTNVVWYTFEVGEHEEAQNLLKIAFEVCEEEYGADKFRETLVYAHLCNTAGSVEIELNDLQKARQYYEIALVIRRKLLAKDSEELANTINNMGNVESAEGNVDTALKLFQEAEDIRVRHGDDSAIPLAFTYITKGRAYYLKGKFVEALEQYTRAESIALQYAGRNSVPIALIHYELGNLDRSKKSFRDAKRHYAEAVNIFTQKTPMHIQTSCAFYKLGCVEADLGNYDFARRNLDRAYEIGDFRRTGVDDGNIARILWKKALLTTDNPTDDAYEYGEKLNTRNEALLMRTAVEQKVNIRTRLTLEDDMDHNLTIGETSRDDEEKAFDRLVCGYYR